LGLSLPLFDLNPKESPKELFAREKELDELVRLVEARRWVALLGPRMVGKTSLIKVANVRLKAGSYTRETRITNLNIPFS